MRKYILPFLLLSLAISGCNSNTNSNHAENKDDNTSTTSKTKDYGAFLGRSENNDKGFTDYEYISFEFDEFSNEKIKKTNESGTKTFAYLNIGSIETYRDYYDDFKDITFAEYENWEDERWVNVDNSSWQNFVINSLGKHFKEMGAYGVYMDNVDVYTVWSELGHNKNDLVSGLKNIIKGIADLGLKVMVNGGSEFLDDMISNNDIIIDSIFAYHQEEVFSLIEDYDKNIFGTQDKEDSEYYQGIAKELKNKGKEIFLLEYAKSASLIYNIESYCKKNNYHYYISSTVGLY